MLLTEEQAKEKWCPKRGSARDIADTFYRVQGYEPSQAESHIFCIATGCAMWRWGETTLICPKCESHMWSSVNGADEYKCSRCSTVMDEQRDRGYCGLAGKP